MGFGYFYIQKIKGAHVLAVKNKPFSLILFMTSIVVFLLAIVIIIFGIILYSPGKSNSAFGDSQKVLAAIPKDNELAKIDLFENDTYFNLKNETSNDPSYVPLITVKAEIKYYLNVKDSSIRDSKAKLQSYLGEIQELVSLYLKDLTPQQARNMQKQAGEDLKSQINNLLNKNEDKHGDVVYSFTFTKWLIT